MSETNIETPHAEEEEETLFVLDTTCKEDVNRTHEMPFEGRTVPITFKYDTPRELPFALAIKFLKTPSFVCTDEEGTPIPFDGIPKQPGELQAGEELQLQPNEVVAKLDELTVDALVLRANVLPDGEKLNKRSGKDNLIAFIVDKTTEQNAANTRSEGGEDEFTPPALDDGLVA
ncbi:hypothetical protein QMT40_001786 [Parvibaculaceae bacterium PLY_AMNH_Bact1]|nr:hypothetical protein QMT40_001786 [Parvibaculaceae bacterium PLY_AMNH_Bact1]